MNLSANEWHVLELLSRSDLNDDMWRRDRLGRPWSKRERRFGHHGVRAQGRARTLWALKKKNLVDISSATTMYVITKLGRAVLQNKR